LSLIHALNTAPQKPGIKQMILTLVSVLPPGSGNSGTPPPSKTQQHVALWDTGATNSVICKSVASAMGLQPISARKMHTANGDNVSNVYLVDLALPNNVILEAMQVSEADFTTFNPTVHMLIGMDVINLGDFSITNYKGDTVMNFRLPSFEEHDFVLHANKHNSVMMKRLQKQNSPTKIRRGKRR
jgi:predicted aspartyl protease